MAKAAKAPAPAKHKVPTEAEVFAALNAPSTTAPPTSSRLTNLLYLFGALAVGLMSMLFKDANFVRNKVGKHTLPWKSPVLDRVFVVVVCSLFFMITAMVLERPALVRAMKQTYRTHRQAFISWWKLTYRTRHRIFFQYMVLLAQVAVVACAWRAVVLVTNCSAPMVVVLSGSMEPAFYRGDILLLNNSPKDPISPGEIIVFRIDGRDIPIVHRMMQVHRPFNNSQGTELFLTKGDNNNGHDRPLYAPGQLWLLRREIMGRARFFIPYVGMITVKVNEYPTLKLVVIVIMLSLTLYTKEL
ncbi:hypothetical protein BASA81_001049 [Batrachochytrium salamandrivorans]|nr:hypothetical protein BASA81_001049 [Batrachochytrium salamandrivorans]